MSSTAARQVPMLRKEKGSIFALGREVGWGTSRVAYWGRRKRMSDTFSRADLAARQPRTQPTNIRLQRRPVDATKSLRAAREQLEQQFAARETAASVQQAPEFPMPETFSEHVPPRRQTSTFVEQRSPSMGQASEIEIDEDEEDFRLPAAWYVEDETEDGWFTGERRAHVIRGSAAACVATGVALLVWLGTAGNSSNLAQPAQQLAKLPALTNSLTSSPMATAVWPVETRSTDVGSGNDVQRNVPTLKVTTVPVPVPAVPPAGRGGVTTAQILARAENFVATGDVLAARFMLQDTVAAGDPKALFALAEMYDPNILSSWNARDAEPSIPYARSLYEAALKAGIAEARTRLDTLK